MRRSGPIASPKQWHVADPDVTRAVTPRHLLTHTSGIDGDVFTDTGRGDDCLERYVAELAEVEQNHPLGATWSYCNSGYGVAGRLVEHVTGATWDAALRERLIEPLGLEGTGTLPEEAILHRVAVGHVGEPHEEPRPATSWVLPRSAGPAGLICARVADVLAFVQMHLAGGVAADRRRVLSAAAAEAMVRSVFEELAGASMQSPVIPSTSPIGVDPARYVGRYERTGVTTEVFEDARGLMLRSTITGAFAELVPEPVHEYVLEPVEPDVFALRAPGVTTWSAVTFYSLENARYVHYAARANPLVAS